MSRYKIALIFHEQDRKRIQNYAVNKLLPFWRSEGIDTFFIFGTKTVIPADLAILHVNLSVVPDEYLEYARDYPYTLNGKVKDIRKSLFSSHIVRPGDGYHGKVIVKSDLNYAGRPERRASRSLALWGRLVEKFSPPDPADRKQQPLFNSPLDYTIFERPDLVPPDWFERTDIVIEKFLPEMQQGYYCIRNYYFLGDRGICVMKLGIHPIVNSSTTTIIERVMIHPKIVSLRETYHFDYGKFDYTMHDNIPVLFDMNKTPGSAHSSCPVDPRLHREWAAGIRSYFS